MNRLPSIIGMKHISPTFMYIITFIEPIIYDDETRLLGLKITTSNATIILLNVYLPYQCDLDNSLTFRNGRLSFDVHRRSRLNRESSLLPYSQLHVPVKPKASLEAAREVDFGRSSASVLQASLRLDLSPESPVMTLSFI